MIVFCEDCGEKNALPSKNIRNGRIVFTCKACDYSNDYVFDSSIKKCDKKVSSFEQLTASKEIIGGFFYHRNQGVLFNNMPEILNRADLDFIGSNLLNSIDVCSESDLDIEQMLLYIPNRHTAVRMIDTDSIAVIVSGTHTALYQLSDFFKNLTADALKMNE